MIVVDFDVSEIDWAVNLLDKKELDKIPGNVAKKLSKEALKNYQKTVATWEVKPEFQVMTEVSGSRASFLIGTDDPIYRYVDFGTRPHIIRARNAPYLVFRVGGKPKTRPGILQSGPGRPGTRWVRVKEVHHPGIRKRGFTEIIEKKIDNKLTDTVTAEVDKVLTRYQNKARKKRS